MSPLIESIKYKSIKMLVPRLCIASRGNNINKAVLIISAIVIRTFLLNQCHILIDLVYWVF